MFAHFTSPQGVVDTTEIAKAFLWCDESKPADEKAAYSLPFADIVDGELKIVPVGVQACAGGHGIGQLKGPSAEEVATIKSRIGELYAKIQEQFPDSPSNPFDPSN